MSDTNNSAPAGTGEGMSTADIVDALAGILDDPETDNGKGAGKQAADKAKPEDNADEPDEGEDAPEDEADDAEDPKGEESEEGQGQLRDAKGRFLSDDDKVRLADGTVTTVKDLKEGSLRQGDYTRKTQEVAEERKTLEAHRQRVSQHAQQLEAQLAVNLQWMELTKPVRPEVSYEQDPMAHLKYQDESQRWNEANSWVQGHLKAARDAAANAQREALAAYEKREDDALRTAIPALRDPAKHRAFMAELEKIVPEYGITADELKGVKDHRQLLVLRDALAYRRMKARAPEVRKEVESKPQMLQAQRRTVPQQAQKRARQDRTERLKKEGSFDAGVAALMDMNL